MGVKLYLSYYGMGITKAESVQVLGAEEDIWDDRGGSHERLEETAY
jgi:hypothetical protein